MGDIGDWHVADDSLHDWVGGSAGPLTSVSIEQHLLNCSRCRARVALLVPRRPIELGATALIDECAAPPSTRLQRTLNRLGVGSSDSLVITSAITSRMSWLAGVTAVMVFALLAALFGNGNEAAVFLVAAPLLPVAGVAAAYGRNADPLYELSLAAPYAMVRLVLLRTVVAVVTSAPATIVAGLLLPVPGVVAVAWILPATCFVSVVLAASCWVEPMYAAAAVALLWIVAVVRAGWVSDELAVLTPTALFGYLGGAALAALIFAARVRAAVPSWRLR